MKTQIKIFYDSNMNDVETQVNSFLKTLALNPIDIKFSCDEKSFNVMVIYLD
jgi:hypothetical protein